MIIAKCCHDLDLISWFTGDDCESVTSYGSLDYFTEKNAPEGSADRCLDCKFADTCVYSAKKIYITDRAGKGNLQWPCGIVVNDLTVEKLYEALKTSKYGKCVYKCDNNVVDHQVVNIKFKNNATAQLTLTAFSQDCYREIHVHCENGCFGRKELLALNMKRKGLLGEIVYAEGGYCHDLRDEILGGTTYRLQEYIHRNAENYPTHEIGPIAKILDIGTGNRFTSLQSFGTKSVGLEARVKQKNMENLYGVKFNQSDVVTTIIKCQNGEMVNITLDTSLPRYYSRKFCIHGTKGIINEENSSVLLDGMLTKECWDWSSNYNNITEFYEKYDHPLWVGYTPHGGHGGMEWLCTNAFFDAVRDKKPMPVDVYDMACWMVITVLSEQSLSTGTAIAFPDFTEGKWITRKNEFML